MNGERILERRKASRQLLVCSIKCGGPKVTEARVYELVESDVEMFELLGGDIIASGAEE